MKKLISVVLVLYMIIQPVAAFGDIDVGDGGFLDTEAQENFSDVKDSDWFSGETAKAKYYGYIEDMKARPEEPASSEDVV